MDINIFFKIILTALCLLGAILALGGGVSAIKVFISNFKAGYHEDGVMFLTVALVAIALVLILVFLVVAVINSDYTYLGACK